MVQFNMDVPLPTMIGDDAAASELLRLALRKVEEDPRDFIGFDTETNALKIPLKGTKSNPGKASSTDPLDWMRDTVTFWSLSFSLSGKYERYCLRQQDLHRFVPLLENPKANLVTWNGKYDAHVCHNSGVYVWASNYMDGLAMGHLVDENLQGQMGLKERSPDPDPFGLNKVVENEWVPIHMTKYKDLFPDVDAEGNKIQEYEYSLFKLYDQFPQKVSDYASLDAYATLMLVEHLRDGMKHVEVNPEGGTPNMWEYYLDMEKDCTEVLWRMERRGLGIDSEYLESLIEPMSKRLLAIEKDIYRTAGWPVNINSTQQLRELFFGPPPKGLGLKPKRMTKGGKTLPAPSTDKDVLDELAAEGTLVAKKIKEFRSVQKTKSTYVDSLLRLSAWHDDGRVHPGFNQFGARTGRFSSVNPNSMNMPRPDTDEFQIRKAFVAPAVDPQIWTPPGRKVRRAVKKLIKKLIVGDYAQLEMRIMAHFSQDQGMIGAIRADLDLHCVTVEKMFHVPYDEVNAAKKAEKPTERQTELKLFRQRSKAIGFGLIYGAMAKNISGQLEIPVEEAQELIELYFEAYPGVKTYMDRTIRECRFDGFVKTLVGRRRNLPDINHHRFMKFSHAEREAVNATIQGSAADITKAGMLNIEFDEELQELGVELLNQIHDELVMECPEENCLIALPIIKRHMEYPFGGQEALCVPTPTDLKIVNSWNEAK